MMAKTLQGYGVDLVITATETGLSEADEIVHRAAALANGLIKCEFCDVFGQRYVTVQSHSQGKSEYVQSEVSLPLGTVQSVPVVVQSGLDCFELIPELLEGLVGFETGNIRRQGLCLYLFSEYGTADSIQTRYNATLQTLIRSALGRAAVATDVRESDSDVSVVSFNSKESAAVHESISVLGQRPLDRTVIYSVDEFWSSDDDTKEYRRQGSLLTNVSVPERRDFLRDAEDYIVDWTTAMRNQTVPYCGNVLLLAFRQDILLACHDNGTLSPWGKDLRSRLEKPGWSGIPANVSEIGPQSWEDVYLLAMALLRTANANSNLEPPISHAFCVDRSADETLACALMDAIIAGMPESDAGWIREQVLDAVEKKGRVQSRSLRDEFYRSFGKKLRGSFAENQFFEVRWLGKLLQLAKDADSDGRLVSDASVFLCWYSQLRDLIERNENLADRLQVCALPAGGFTGDWFVGISQGSVSKSLGKTILQVLCSETEEYKRFAMGVGLPVSTRMYGGAKTGTNKDLDPRFYAWPNSHCVPLRKLLVFHQQALSRQRISGYRRFRSTLSTIGRQLVPALDRCTTDDQELEAIKDNVGRLSAQVRLFVPENEYSRASDIGSG